MLVQHLQLAQRCGLLLLLLCGPACATTTGAEGGYDAVRYTRCNNNPSQVVLGQKLAELEGEVQLRGPMPGVHEATRQLPTASACTTHTRC